VVDQRIPFGAVSFGAITCQAYIQEGEIVRHTEEVLEDPSKNITRYFHKSKASRACPLAEFDTKMEETEIVEKFARSLCVVLSSSNYYFLAGLILLKNDDTTYRREGIWSFRALTRGVLLQDWIAEKKKWFEACERRTVVIV